MEQYVPVYIKGCKLMNYETVIGLEVHSELSTKSKIFCACENKFGSEENSQCCPVCSGMPGALPVLNKKVVDYAVKMGLALNCEINRVCRQDRKNYFYPDLPKAYQISQLHIPLCGKGYLEFFSSGQKRKVDITRIHIEEDAGKLLHEGYDGTLVDFNRCGVPLIEIVSEPDMRSSEEAKDYLETIKTTLQYLDISDCKMQEGSIRCDINVSVRKMGDEKLGTRVEMKNVNSFSAAVRAIDYESKRQIELLENGKAVEQETRRWDDDKGINIVLRSKEDAHDYRYFPEPDLCPIVISDEWFESIKEGIPELPNAKYERYITKLGLSEKEADQLCKGYFKTIFFDECVNLNAVPKTVSNWILGDISKYLNDAGCELQETKLTPQMLVSIIDLVENNTVSISAAKKILDEVFNTGDNPKIVVDRLGLKQNSDEDSILEIAKTVLEANPKSVADYKAGKTNALGFLIGQAMKESKGKANPQILNKIIKELLEKQL